MHFVVRSEKARGAYSMLSKHHAQFIKALVRVLSVKWDVRIHEFSNNGNHLHLLVQGRTVQGMRNFSRVLTALIARRITGARKVRANGGSFWDSIPFTRIVEWGNDFFGVKNYVCQNRLEAARAVAYHPRESAAPYRLGLFAT